MGIIEKIINKVEELLSKDKCTFNVPELLEFLYSLKAEEKETPEIEPKAVQYCFDKGYNLTPRIAADIARHFYELGKNSK